MYFNYFMSVNMMGFMYMNIKHDGIFVYKHIILKVHKTFMYIKVLCTLNILSVNMMRFMYINMKHNGIYVHKHTILKVHKTFMHINFYLL